MVHKGFEVPAVTVSSSESHRRQGSVVSLEGAWESTHARKMRKLGQDRYCGYPMRGVTYLIYIHLFKV